MTSKRPLQTTHLTTKIKKKKKLSQTSSTSSISSSQSNTEDWQQQLETAQRSLKEMYLTRFQEVRPFSLPFTFHIDNTWVSLALKEDKKDSEATEDHAELLERAFQKAKMLIIEGDPATGKTSLMRRLAYEWAKGKQELLHYDLVLYAEFREVREETFQSITDFMLYYSKKYLAKEGYENLKNSVNNEKHCKECRILVLLDGYDESSLEKQCIELSSYINDKMIKKPLLFNTVITTRKGYLSMHRGVKVRLVFAEVLGFTTMTQKETYIFKHFLSQDIDNEKNISSVHNLLANNENLNKLAETPLFLTFICLVHERIVEGTLLELYCNIIRWLIDRHQQDFPDRDIPALFGYQSDSTQASEPLNLRKRQNNIQKHYLQFPQLLCLGKMALNNLKKDIFQESDFSEFSVNSIVHHVGLIRKDENYDQSWNLTSKYSFSHRTIREFLAAFYCFCSNEPTNEWLLPDSKLDTSEKANYDDPSGMNEFERFLLRIALSVNMPIQAEKRKYYSERFTDINLDITFDAFNTAAGFNNELLNWFLSQCTNVQNIRLMVTVNRHANTFDDTSEHNGSLTPNMSSSTLFSFSDLIKLHSLTFGGEYSWQECTFSANSQLSFTNCPSLKSLQFRKCEMKSSTIVGIATLPAIDTLEFYECTFSADSQLSFTNCPSLKNLIFSECKMKSSKIVGIATLPAIPTVQFYRCNIDIATWQSITEQISNSSVKYLKLTFEKDFNMEFLIHLQQCNNIEQMEITIRDYTIRQNDLLSFSHLIKLHSLTFGGGLPSHGCTFSANSQLSFTNCPSLKNLQFDRCEMKSSTIVGIATLPAIGTVQFSECRIDLATWQSITDQISNSSVKYLKLTFGKHSLGSGDDFNKKFLIHLQQCNNIEQMEITIRDYTIRQNDLLSYSHLIKLHSLTFGGYNSGCTFSANSQLSFTNCPSLKNLEFKYCVMESSTIVGIATLLAINTVQFFRCNINLPTWQSLANQISNSNVTCFHLSVNFFEGACYPLYLHHLQKCERIQQITVNDYYDKYIDKFILKLYEESVTANLALTAKKLPALTSIIISDESGKRLDESRRLSERNKERIEKAGQERNPAFSIKYVE